MKVLRDYVVKARVQGSMLEFLMDLCLVGGTLFADRALSKRVGDAECRDGSLLMNIVMVQARERTKCS